MTGQFIDPNLKYVFARASRMVGRILDIVDASYGDDVQRQKIKKLMQPALYDYRNEMRELVKRVEQSLPAPTEEAPPTEYTTGATEYVQAQEETDGERIRREMKAREAKRVDTGADSIEVQQATEQLGSTDGIQTQVERHSGTLTQAQLDQFMKKSG